MRRVDIFKSCGTILRKAVIRPLPLVAAGVFIGGQASALSAISFGGLSFVELTETGEAGCPVQFEFKNDMVHSKREELLQLELAGVVVDFIFVLGPAEEPDTIHLMPQDGMVAIPSEITVPEGESGFAQICVAMF